MNEIMPVIEGFLQYGALGAIAVVSIYQVLVMEKKLFEIIEKNTKVLTELKGTIEKCQIIHSDK
jgi:hypothetical protein